MNVSRATTSVSPSPSSQADERPRADRARTIVVSVGLGFLLLSSFGAFDNFFGFGFRLWTGAYFVIFAVILSTATAGAVGRVLLPLPFLLLAVWWVTSYAWSADPQGYALRAPKDMLSVVTIVFGLQLLSTRAAWRLLHVVGLTAILLIPIAIVTRPSLALSSTASELSLQGSFIHKNFLAPVLVMFAITSLTSPLSTGRRWFWIATVGTLLVLSQSTTGLFVLVVVLVSNSVLDRWRRVRERLGRAAGPALALSAVGVLVLAYAISTPVLAAQGKDLSLSARTGIWDGAWTAITERPLGGWGWGLWDDLASDPAASIITSAGFDVAIAHNAALEILLRLGVVGLALIVWQLVWSARSASELFRRGDDFGRTTLLLIISLLVFGVSESHTMVGGWFGLLVGMGALCARAAADDDADRLTSDSTAIEVNQWPAPLINESQSAPSRIHRA